MPKYIIAGIDPGTAIGIAILDLQGRKIATLSASNGIGEAVALIERHGTPSLIACDKVPAPEMVQKAASYFSCRLYAPPRNIREEEKRLIARGAGVENNHERDAYAAAVFGFRFYANKLRQIDALPDLRHEEKEKIKHLLLKGYRIRDAFASLGTEEGIEDARGGERRQERELAQATSRHALSADELKERVSALARENSNLRLLLERLEGEKQELSSRLSLLQNDYRRSLLQDSELRRLKYQLQQSISRLGWGKKKKTKGSVIQGAGKQAPKETRPAQAVQPGKVGSQRAQHEKEPLKTREPRTVLQGKEEDINVEEEKLDIEKLVMEYRRGRNTGK
ncbi:Uncharacterised protein [uncultured archaeon]|nr:Uncharacterised protein [uncultured archaeon]